MCGDPSGGVQRSEGRGGWGMCGDPLVGLGAWGELFSLPLSAGHWSCQGGSALMTACKVGFPKAASSRDITTCR